MKEFIEVCVKLELNTFVFFIFVGETLKIGYLLKKLLPHRKMSALYRHSCFSLVFVTTNQLCGKSLFQLPIY